MLSAAAPVHRFDPTAAAATEEDLRPLAHALCDDPEDRSYWAQHASRILLVLMLAAKQAHEPVFPFVARAVRSGATRALAMLTDVDPALADRVRAESRNTFARAWETLATRCESILSPHAVATLSGSDFGPADLLRQRATLYLQIPEARLADLRPFLRLVWTSLMQQLTTASDLAGGQHHPLLLVLDEAGRAAVCRAAGFPGDPPLPPDLLRRAGASSLPAPRGIRTAGEHDPGELLAPRLRPERGYRDGGIHL